MLANVEDQAPFDSFEIRIDRKNLSLEYVLCQIEHDNLDLYPDFRPQMDTWADNTQSRLIESLLLRIPIPVFYFNATNDDKWEVIDGVQRLTALARFVMDEQTLKKLNLKRLKLCDLEFLTDLYGKTFDDLDGPDQRRIETTPLDINIIDQNTHPDVKYHIFKRVHADSLRYNHFFTKR